MLTRLPSHTYTLSPQQRRLIPPVRVRTTNATDPVRHRVWVLLSGDRVSELYTPVYRCVYDPSAVHLCSALPLTVNLGVLMLLPYCRALGARSAAEAEAGDGNDGAHCLPAAYGPVHCRKPLHGAPLGDSSRLSLPPVGRHHMTRRRGCCCCCSLPGCFIVSITAPSSLS